MCIRDRDIKDLLHQHGAGHDEADEAAQRGGDRDEGVAEGVLDDGAL